jgi:hypothetical protein
VHRILRLAGLTASCTPQTSSMPGLRTRDGTEKHLPRWRTEDVAWHCLWRTGAGGVTSYTVVAAPVEDLRHRAVAPVEDRSQRTLREPAALAGVMDRRRSGQSSDLESQSLRTQAAGLVQRANWLLRLDEERDVRRTVTIGLG